MQPNDAPDRDPVPAPPAETREDPRIAAKVRAVMEEIRSCTPGARLAQVPTLFAFGPIYRAIAEAERRAEPSLAPPAVPPRKYGCHQCGQDYEHDPFTYTVEGVPAQTYFFCSVDCREDWFAGVPERAAERAAPSPADPIDGKVIHVPAHDVVFRRAVPRMDERDQAEWDDINDEQERKGEAAPRSPAPVHPLACQECGHSRIAHGNYDRCTECLCRHFT